MSSDGVRKSGSGGGALGAVAKALPVVGLVCGLSASAAAAPLPDPQIDESLVVQDVGKPAPQRSLVVAGGCFWGVQAVFQHVKGVVSAVSGYAGGKADTAHYEIVSSGATGHAEAVKVTYDSSVVTMGRLLKVFFSVAHDPTQVGGQGPDHGDQYRSAVFYSSDEQRRIAESYVKQLDAAKVFKAPVATKIEPLKEFYPAEAYHQDYARLHPDAPYIVYHDLPKLKGLKQSFPEDYIDPSSPRKK